jgi:beta-galactosidase
MKKTFCIHPFLIILIVAFAIVSCKSGDNFISTNRDRLFNEGWKFMKDSLTGAEQPGYDDSQWQTLDLPHDWSIAKLPGNDEQDRVGPFLKSSQGATSTGYVVGGTAWYRKHLKLDKADAGKTVVLRFDGVYMEAEVWVNGKLAGNHVYGYTPFWFDITSLLNKTGGDNVIAVRVNNTGRNSRWYSGSGIYRNVYLTITDQVHVSVWGVQVTTAEIKTKTAIVDLAVTVQNDADKDIDASFAVRILAPGGKMAGMADGTIKISSREKSVFKQQFSIDNPVLWSLSSPGLYQAEVTMNTNGKISDRFIQSFGIRSVEVTAEKGFLLNGNPIKLKGGCMHHDNGLLGSAAYERAEERRVEIMKANGFNAIRTSHNPPSEAFLNACDRLGMLVIDETFDCWERPKNQQDYHRFFKAWWKNDVAAMIMRDRNHPCVIMWSIGNEINERADTSGIRIAKSIISFIRQMDTTRPFTNAICEFWDNPGTSWETTANAFALLTVGGYNYQYLRYESDHEKFPGRIMMGTESVPKVAFENWQQVEKHPYVFGDFVWTGMDYLGETGIGHTQYLTEGQQDVFAMPWPWFNAWCGDIDIIGNKKPQMLYRDVIWGNSKLEINVHAPVPEGKTEKVSYWGWPDEYPHWNWNGNEDKIIQVSVYTKGTAVRLLLNGREIGFKKVSPETKLMAIFDVPYEPGELKAVAYENDREIAVKLLKTSGVPAGIRLIADRNPIKADRNDLSYVTIEIIDEFGQVVTDASNQVKITLTGNGELAGSGNACPYDMKSIGKNQFNTFHGKAMAIIRPYAEPGTITLKAVSGGLKEGTVKVKVE